MKFVKNKKPITIAFLALTIFASIILIPFTDAHSPAWNINTWCFVNVRNSVLGVGQEQLIAFWLQDYPPTAEAAFGDRWTFYVDIMKPDGTNQTLGPVISDNVGGGFTTFTPTETGNYTVVSRFIEHKITGLPISPGKTISTINGAAYVNDTYLASTSGPVKFTVQELPIELWPETPLPSEYWIRPINMANRDWYVLTGNWLGGAAQTGGPAEKFAYGPGPVTAHIMWSKPYWAGGTMDVRYGSLGYQTAHYGGLVLSSPIIINGKFYYTTQTDAHTRQGYTCLDLYTGETIAENGNVTLSFGSIYNYESPNQHGGFPYLWRTSGVTLGSGNGTVWEIVDAHTGASITRIANVSSGGTAVYGKDGSILRYNLATAGGVQYLRVWNASAMTSMLLGATGTDSWQWRPQLVAVHDGNKAWSLNVTISPAVQGSIIAVREDEYVIGGTTNGYNDDRGTVQNNMWALSLKRGEEGRLLWNYSYTPPKAAAVPGVNVNSYRGMRYESMSPEDGVFIFREQLTRKYWGYNIETGQQLWETEPENQMSFYGLSTAVNTKMYDGKFFSYGYGGEVVAYDIKTGEKLWTYTAENVGVESPYGNYPVGIACIADEKLYLTTSEHSVTSPLFRGSYIRCIYADNGTEIWKVLHWSDGTPGVAGSGLYIADGFLVSLNFYDNKLYCYGKGPSATTISAPDTVQPLNTPVLIKGTITDTAAGSEQEEQAARFPDGVPAVSDDNMQAWMEYVYMQQQKPTDVKGVDVVVSVIDPNNNFYEVGRTTSDSNGMYKLMFTPEVPGEYTVVARFEGSNSYYASQAQTALGVVAVSQPTTEPIPVATESIADLYFVPAVIGIILANLAIGIMVILLLRKRQ